MERSINSILNQTYTDIEVLLIDDGSPDNSGKICDEFAKKDSRVKVFHKENGGVSSARNLGLDNATGDYIGFVDPDDIIDPNMYNDLMKVLVSTNSDISFCDYCCFSDYNDINFSDKKNTIEEYTRNELLKEALVPNTKICLMGTIWNRLYKYDIVKDIRFNETLKNGEDTEYAFNCIMKSNKLVMTDATYYRYFVRSDGAVGNQSDDSRIAALGMRKNIMNTVYSMNDMTLSKNVSAWYVFALVGVFLNISSAKQKQLKNECREYFFIAMKCKGLSWKTKLLFAIKLIVC